MTTPRGFFSTPLFMGIVVGIIVIAAGAVYARVHITPNIENSYAPHVSLKKYGSWYLPEMATSSPGIADLKEKLSSCPASFTMNADYSLHNSNLSPGFRYLVTPDCLYYVGQAQVNGIAVLNVSLVKKSPLVSFTDFISRYAEYNGELYYEGRFVNGNVATFAEGAGGCSGPSDYVIVDGHIVRQGMPTEIPSAICTQPDLFGNSSTGTTTDHVLYKGAKTAYLITTYGEINGVPKLSIAELPALASASARVISTGTVSSQFTSAYMSWLVTDGVTVAWVGFISDGTGYAFEEPFVKVIPGADPDSIRSLSIDYAVDDAHAYFREQLIKGADAASFVVDTDYPGGFESTPSIRAHDKNSKYVGATKVSI